MGLADRFIRHAGGRYLQLFGNHEGQRFTDLHLRHAGPLPRETLETIQRWRADGRAHLAVALDTQELGPLLVTHAGLSPQASARPGRSRHGGGRRPAHRAVGGARRRPRLHPGAAGAGDGFHPGVTWGEPADVYTDWLAEADPPPFGQVHGHASAWSWKHRRWRKRTPAAVRAAGVLRRCRPVPRPGPDRGPGLRGHRPRPPGGAPPTVGPAPPDDRPGAVRARHRRTGTGHRGPQDRSVPPMRNADRRLDVVVFGATSFVGEILCRHLVERHGTDGPLRWAIAGRSATKLDAVARSTGADVERIVADAADAHALADLAGATRVVVSTVGPYALYGSPSGRGGGRGGHRLLRPHRRDPVDAGHDRRPPGPGRGVRSPDRARLRV